MSEDSGEDDNSDDELAYLAWMKDVFLFEREKQFYLPESDLQAIPESDG